MAEVAVPCVGDTARLSITAGLIAARIETSGPIHQHGLNRSVEQLEERCL